jgi:hypothetical protein
LGLNVILRQTADQKIIIDVLLCLVRRALRLLEHERIATGYFIAETGMFYG